MYVVLNVNDICNLDKNFVNMISLMNIKISFR